MPGGSSGAPEYRGQPLVIRRRLAAPRELVFEAWTQPEHLLHWFCPRGFVVLEAETDVRVGGAWRSRLRSPAGELFEEQGVYREIDEPARLVFTHAWITPDGQPPVRTLVTVELTEESDGATHMTFTQVGFPTAASYGANDKGWNEAFDTLGVHLPSTSTPELRRTRPPTRWSDN